MNEITLDWDIKWETYQQSKNWKRLVDWFHGHEDAKQVTEVKVRRSSSGNVHVILITPDMKAYDPMAFFIRAYLADDPIRHIIDMVRCYKGEPFNRLWDFKEGESGAVKAGDWQVVLKR